MTDHNDGVSVRAALKDIVERNLAEAIKDDKSPEEIERIRNLIEVINDLEDHFSKVTLIRFLSKLSDKLYKIYLETLSG